MSTVLWKPMANNGLGMSGTSHAGLSRKRKALSYKDLFPCLQVQAKVPLSAPLSAREGMQVEKPLQQKKKKSSTSANRPSGDYLPELLRWIAILVLYGIVKTYILPHQ